MAEQPDTLAIPMHETPEFRAAVAKAAADAVAHAMANAMAAQPAAAPSGVAGGVGDTASLLQGLAMALAELSDQGPERRKLPPDEVRRRVEARKRMENAILMARAEERRAVYRLASKLFLDEAIIEPIFLDSAKKAQPTTIEFDGVPNEALIPMNATAGEIHTAYMESIGDKAVWQAATMDAYVKPDPYITPRGVVINGTAPARRDLSGPGQHGRVLRGDDESGAYRTTRILGTVADPVMQTA